MNFNLPTIYIRLYISLVYWYNQIVSVLCSKSVVYIISNHFYQNSSVTLCCFCVSVVWTTSNHLLWYSISVFACPWDTIVVLLFSCNVQGFFAYVFYKTKNQNVLRIRGYCYCVFVCLWIKYGEFFHYYHYTTHSWIPLMSMSWRIVRFAPSS